MQNWIKAAAIAVNLALPGVALAQSLESLVNVQGVRENQLVGYSLVVGLDGTGDKNQVKFTNQTITNMLRQPILDYRNCRILHASCHTVH